MATTSVQLGDDRIVYEALMGYSFQVKMKRGKTQQQMPST